MKKINDFFKNTIKETNFIKGLVSIALMILILFLLNLTSNIWGSWLALIKTALLPFLIAYLLAFILSPLVNMIDKKIKRRGLSILIVSLLIVVVIAVCIFILIPNIFVGFQDLTKMGIDGVTSLFETLQKNNFFGIDKALKEMDIHLMDYVSVPNIAKTISQFLADSGFLLVRITYNVITTALNFLVMFILTIYFLTNEKDVNQLIKKGASKINPNLPVYLKNSSVEVHKYINAFGKVMLSKAPQYMILYYIFGHENWFLLGILNMVAVLIPYIGPVIVNILSLITALSQGPFTIFGTIFTIGWSSFVDQYLITPRMYGTSIELNPLLQVFGIFVNATLFGTLGVIIAIPEMLIIRSIYQTHMRFKEAKKEASVTQAGALLD